MNKSFDVLPRDKYIVMNAHKLTSLDERVIHLLYQPLLDTTSVSLYFSLISEMGNNQMWSVANDHYFLLDLFAINITKLLSCRKKLEAIGLIRVYCKSGEVVNQYVYEICPPLSAEQFFKDRVLSICLEQKVGTSHFTRLQILFSDRKIPEDYTEITASFDEVFATNIKNSAIETKELTMPEKQFFKETQKGYRHNFHSNFDFELLFELLKNNFIERKSLTPHVLEIIAVLSYLYNISVIDMSKLILRHSDSLGTIDVEELQKSARKSYIDINKALPKLSERVQPENLREITNPQTAEEHLLFSFENVSPVEFLSSLPISQGAKPSESTLALIENLMVNKNLNPSVVNVLLHYVLQKTDNKLSKNYVETIADTLARKKITTARAAFKHFCDEIKASSSKAPPKAKRDNYSNRKQKRDIVPDWMKDETNSKKISEPDPKELAEIKRMLAERRR